MTLPLSVLDLAFVSAGSSPAAALRQTVDIARLVDRAGYTRLWFAEHHGMPSIASSSPAVLIGHVASATERIRVGSGGIMLPNHVPLQLAESFHTLEALHPGRIDLGIGRAPGTDPMTSRALHPFPPEQYGDQLRELVGLSRETLPREHPFHRVRVVPRGVTLPPIWLLGSSGGSAQLAGAMGFGYGFAAHFSQAPARPAIDIYRSAFQPSAQFPAPHVILALSVICAESDEQADYLASSVDLFWLRFQRGEFGPLPTAAEGAAYPFTPQERAIVESRRPMHVIGSPATARAAILARAAEAGADEVMISTSIPDAGDRARSYELLADSFALSDAALVIR